MTVQLALSLSFLNLHVLSLPKLTQVSPPPTPNTAFLILSTCLKLTSLCNSTPRLVSHEKIYYSCHSITHINGPSLVESSTSGGMRMLKAYEVSDLYFGSSSWVWDFKWIYAILLFRSKKTSYLNVNLHSAPIEISFFWKFKFQKFCFPDSFTIIIMESMKFEAETTST